MWGAFYVSGGFPLGSFYWVVAIDVAHDGVEVFFGVHAFVDLIGDAGGGSDGVLLAFGLGGVRGCCGHNVTSLFPILADVSSREPFRSAVEDGVSIKPRA